MASYIEKGLTLSPHANPKLRLLMGMASQGDLSTRRRLASNLRNKSFPTTGGQVQSRKDLQGTWRKMVPAFRILCFSESRDVAPMWLHYADNYKGVVMEFEVVDVTDSPLLSARAVEYLDSPPVLADAKTWVDLMFGEMSQTQLFDDYFYLKTQDWSYEKEWRIVSHARENELGLYADYPFNLGELNTIYFGPNCPDEDKREITSMLIHGLEHVSTRSGVLDKRTSKIIFPG